MLLIKIKISVILQYLFTSNWIDDCMQRIGGVAQMVERSLSMREVPGSMPGASNNFFPIEIERLELFYSLYLNQYLSSFIFLG